MTRPEHTDEQLLRRFLGGHREALGELARRHERGLLGMAAGLLGGRRELACDAVQETWLRVIRFGGQFAGESGLKTWLYRILINQCHTLRAAGGTGKRMGVSGGMVPALGGQAKGGGMATALGGHASDGSAGASLSQAGASRPHTGASPSTTCGTEMPPDARATAADTNHVLHRAVEQLTADQRTTVLLCYHAGMTHVQAAEILEVPLGTLKSRLHAALEALRALLPVDSV